jgi:hypothetical protein
VLRHFAGHVDLAPVPLAGAFSFSNLQKLIRTYMGDFSYELRALLGNPSLRQNTLTNNDAIAAKVVP